MLSCLLAADLASTALAFRLWEDLSPEEAAQARAAAGPLRPGFNVNADGSRAPLGPEIEFKIIDFGLAKFSAKTAASAAGREAQVRVGTRHQAQPGLFLVWLRVAPRETSARSTRAPASTHLPLCLSVGAATRAASAHSCALRAFNTFLCNHTLSTLTCATIPFQHPYVQPYPSPPSICASLQDIVEQLHERLARHERIIFGSDDSVGSPHLHSCYGQTNDCWRTSSLAATTQCGAVALVGSLDWAALGCSAPQQHSISTTSIEVAVGLNSTASLDVTMVHASLTARPPPLLNSVQRSPPVSKSRPSM